MKPHETSCGILIQSGNKFLVCLPSYHSKWSIPKGHQEEGESQVETAFREVKEETGIDLHHVPSSVGFTMKYIGSYELSNKTVVVFHIKERDGYFQTLPLHCDSYFTDKVCGKVPEMIAFKWVTKNELKENFMPSQKCIADWIK